MQAIKRHTMGFVVWSAKISAMVLLLTTGTIFGVWFTIQALAYIVQ